MSATTKWRCPVPSCTVVETLSELGFGVFHSHDGGLWPLRMVPTARADPVPTPKKPAEPVDYAAFGPKPDLSIEPPPLPDLEEVPDV